MPSDSSAQRGRGYGRALMEAADREAQRRGAQSIGLNVFGRNDVARRMYESSGYQVALYNNPEPIIRLINSGPWDADDLSAQVERAFGPLLGRQT